MTTPQEGATLGVADGANVVGSVPDGWWREGRRSGPGSHYLRCAL
ncbi:hypothetical protein AB0D33_35930 [Streptomyces sp. NPDC048404]